MRIKYDVMLRVLSIFVLFLFSGVNLARSEVLSSRKVEDVVELSRLTELMAVYLDKSKYCHGIEKDNYPPQPGTIESLASVDYKYVSTFIMYSHRRSNISCLGGELMGFIYYANSIGFSEVESDVKGQAYDMLKLIVSPVDWEIYSDYMDIPEDVRAKLEMLDYFKAPFSLELPFWRRARGQ